MQTGQASGALDVGNIIGKIRDIPRAAAITEGQKRTRPGTRPPNTTKTEPQDYDFIQVRRRLCRCK